MSNLPIWFRHFVFDAFEGTLTGIVLLNVVIPSSLPEAKSQALIVGATAVRVIIGAAAAAATRNIPGFLAWLSGKLGLPGETG